MKKKSLIILTVLSVIIVLIACNDAIKEKEIPANDNNNNMLAMQTPKNGENISGCCSMLFGFF